MTTAPTVHRFPLGAAQITMILDGQLEVPGDRLFKGFRPEQWAGTIATAADGLVTVSVTVVLVEVDGQRILLDTGLGLERTPQRRGGAVYGVLAEMGLRAADIDRVVISHAHGDHIWGGMIRDGERLVPAFPEARYHVPQADWDWLQRMPENPGSAYITPLATTGQLVLDQSDCQLTPALRSIDTIGHSPGHRCLLLETTDGCFCFLGDLVHHPALHFAYPAIVTDFDYRPALTPVARRQLAAQAVAGDWLLAAAHGESPSLGRLQPAGPDSWRWAPVGVEARRQAD